MRAKKILSFWLMFCLMDMGLWIRKIFPVPSVSDPDPDPYHLVGSGSVSGNVDMDPGSAKN